MGLGLALMNSNKAVQDKIWSKVEEVEDLMIILAATLGYFGNGILYDLHIYLFPFLHLLYQIKILGSLYVSPNG